MTLTKIKRRTILSLPFAFIASQTHGSEQGWRALAQGEAIALIRHAQAPGTGDPANFRIGDCSTQRNLSDEGREQSRRLGALFRAEGIQVARIYSSQWCRCLETAKLMGLGPVNELPALNSFFDNASRGPAQTQELIEWLTRQDQSQPIVLVTHLVNITRLTGIVPRQGEIVFIAPPTVDEIVVIDRQTV
ncbi:histidine phosphatase family protein (plasmid) [Peteryoungia desertarenae]|uniref:Histidine phosphatase family protein n=2 Tax=Peteryoungia desertarenae TaxID=1813451 RepID=A0ABX6QUL0_9HYPH|nr:histidine phosphatase family protein [Peteryoungia desertarenae]